MQRPKKIGSASATAEHSGHLEDFSVTPKGQTTSSAPTVNHRYSLREGLETLIFSTPANNYCRAFRKRLETLTSSAPTNNYCRSLREGLEIQLVSTISTSFISGSDIPEDTSSSIEPAKTGYTLLRGHWGYPEIKDLTSAAYSLCKYTWEVILCMVLIDDGRLGPDIWPETSDQVEGTEQMMRTVWAEESHCQRKISGTKTYSLYPFGKDARHMSPLISCYVTIELLNRHRFLIQS